MVIGRDTVVDVPANDFSLAIASQGVKRASKSDNWAEAWPSLDVMTKKEHLYLRQNIAPIMSARSRSAAASVESFTPSNTFNDPTFRQGAIMNQRPGRPTSALPKVEVWPDNNPWCPENGAIARNRVSGRVKIGSLPTDYVPPEEKITRYTKKYHHKLFPSRTSKQAPVWFAPVKNSDRHIFEKLGDDNPPEWFVDAGTENPFPARSACKAGGIKNPPVDPEGGKQWSVTSLGAPDFMQIKGEPKRKVLPEGHRRVRPSTRSGKVAKSARGNAEK